MGKLPAQTVHEIHTGLMVMIGQDAIHVLLGGVQMEEVQGNLKIV